MMLVNHVLHIRNSCIYFVSREVMLAADICRVMLYMLFNCFVSTEVSDACNFG